MWLFTGLTFCEHRVGVREPAVRVGHTAVYSYNQILLSYQNEQTIATWPTWLISHTQQ